MTSQPPDQAARRAGLAQALAVTVLGIALLMLAYTQPAWLGERVGPGLFAQWSAKGVTALGIVMGALALSGNLRAAPLPRTASLAAGIVILSGAALFAAFARDLGLVIACALAAAFTGWAAGERTRGTVLRSATIGAVAALAIGYSLLPEAAPIWP
jgi:hypothetical protein